MCQGEAQVTDVVQSMRDLFSIFSNSNAQTNDFLNIAFGQPVSMEETSVSWNPNKRLVAFGATSTLYSSKEIERLLKEDRYFWDHVRDSVFEYLWFVPDAVKQHFNNEDDWSIVEISV